MLDISKELQINEQIKDNEIRLIGLNGEQLGLMSAREALKLADDNNTDLVKIAPAAVPPVCRIMDYGKFKFEREKREKEAKKNQNIVEVKGIQLSPNIALNDFNTKVNHAKRFIERGDKVKLSIRFRGRQLGNTKAGEDVMLRFADACVEFATVEKRPKLDGRQMFMFLAPKPTK